MTQKDKMLNMVLNDPKLREAYGYSSDDYESIYDALNSKNAVVVTVAKIIMELNGSTDPGEVKRVYKTIFTYLNNNLIVKEEVIEIVETDLLVGELGWRVIDTIVDGVVIHHHLMNDFLSREYRPITFQSVRLQRECICQVDDITVLPFWEECGIT